jgi:CDP-diacylglycerol--glycerol-3-phosphate 3-phosphatidyltransferase
MIRRRSRNELDLRYDPARMPRPPIHLHAQPSQWRWNWPMGLTTLRLILLPFFLYLLLMDTGKPFPHPHRFHALAVFAIMAATDKLDGYLARKLNQSTHLGAILDPLADKLLVASAVVLLSFDWVAGPDYVVPMWVVLAIYAKDIIVAIGTLALLMVVGKVAIRARLAGKLSTVLQLALVILTMLAADIDSLFPGVARPTLRVFWWAVSIIAAISCVDYLAQGVKAFLQFRRGGKPSNAIAT